MAAVKFNVAHAKLRNAIVDRAVSLNAQVDRVSLIMDLCAANGVNGNAALDLPKLLAFDDFNFSHDVFGIIGTMDRETGQLTRHFLPRCARPERSTVDA